MSVGAGSIKRAAGLNTKKDEPKEVKAVKEVKTVKNVNEVKPVKAEKTVAAKKKVQPAATQSKPVKNVSKKSDEGKMTGRIYLVGDELPIYLM